MLGHHLLRIALVEVPQNIMVAHTGFVLRCPNRCFYVQISISVYPWPGRILCLLYQSVLPHAIKCVSKILAENEDLV